MICEVFCIKFNTVVQHSFSPKVTPTKKNCPGLLPMLPGLEPLALLAVKDAEAQYHTFLYSVSS